MRFTQDRSSVELVPNVDITAPQFKADPFPYYANLRERAPVHPVQLRGKQRAWLVTRYDDVSAALKDERLGKDPANAMSAEQLKQERARMPAAFASLQRTLLSLDGSDHDRLRSLVHQAFTPRRMEQMRELTQALSDSLIDAAVRRGRMDLIADFALPVPLTIIGRIIGVPEEDNGKFRRWMKAFVSATTSPNPLTIPRILQFVRYLEQMVESRRAAPTDDLVSALVKASDADDRLSSDEIVAMLFLLLSAGHETTVNLIGSGTLALLQHPEQLVRLRDEPQLIKPGIEELLRYVVPAETATQRYPIEDVTIAGSTIPRGELVLAVLASANRDPSVFVDPDQVDVTRAPNRHLSFGQGMHYCLGAPLSRLEGQIAISTLLRRLPSLQLAVPAAKLRWRGTLILRGLRALPVTC